MSHHGTSPWHLSTFEAKPSAIKNHQSKIKNVIWRKAKESNPRDAMLGLVFRTSCAPPRTAFRIDLAGTPGFEPRISGLESDGLPLAYAPRSLGACGRTRTYEVRTDARFTVECFCCSATHASEFQISDLDNKISNPGFTVLKNR